MSQSDIHEEKSRGPNKNRNDSCLWLLVATAGCALWASFFVPNLIRRRTPGIGHWCKSNLKNIGTAMEMYSSDWEGKYPNSLRLLTPNYLKSIPECSSVGRVTYEMETGPKAAYNTAGFEDYYFLYCAGSNHTDVSVPTNYPQYDGIQGLIDRPPH